MKSFTSVLVSASLVLALAFAIAPSDSTASRNSGGTYSLPAGNPVVTGTTITTTWANTTLADLGTEITNSLDRGGRGAMTAPLQHSSGTQAAPSLTFSSDTDSGFWRAGADDVRVGAGNTEVQRWTTSGSTFSKNVTITAAAGTAGLTVTGNASGHTAISVTSSSATAVTASSSGGNGAGGAFTGNGSGNGVTGTGGATGKGGAFTGAIGVTGTGTGTTAGGSFANGTAATGGTRQDALTITNGDIDLSGVTVPTSTTAISERLTPNNIVKAWADISTSGAGACTVNDGFNVTSCAVDANVITVTIAADMGSAVYSPLASSHSASCAELLVAGRAAGSFTVRCGGSTGTLLAPNTNAINLSIAVLGAQ